MDPLISTQEQTMRFVEESPQDVVQISSGYESTRMEGIDTDLSLQQFFERPIRIASYDWLIGGISLFEGFNPWTLFFSQAKVINRISNFKNLQAKLHVKAVITGSPFHYGRAILAYTPLHTNDLITRSRSNVRQDLIGLSQKPNIHLNPTTCEGGELVCPFLWHYNSLNVVGADWTEMGFMTLREFTPLVHANGSISPVNITIYAWATDVVLSGPTQWNPASITPQAKSEYSKTPVSYVSSSVASMAKKFVSAPVIGPYAKATEMGANAVGAIATLFGYSKPPDLKQTMIVPRSTYDLSGSTGLDDVTKFTVDPKQELSIDPAIVGLNSEDEMEITRIASRESFLTTFAWLPGETTDTLLFSCVVDPFMFRTNPEATIAEDGITEVHLTSLAFACLPFDYWRGSIKFRFQVVASAYHRGKLLISYDPERVGANVSLNTSYCTVVDIAENPDFEICAAWSQSESYRKHLDLASPTVSTDLFSVTPTIPPYASSSSEWGNGMIAVRVVNPLMSPGESTTAIYCNVFVSAGDDFEVAVPNPRFMSSLRLIARPPPIPSAPFGALTEDDSGLSVIPEQSVELFDKNSLLPQSQIDCVGAETPLTSHMPDVHFGESLRSFRPLLKRYTMSEAISIPAEPGSSFRLNYACIQRPAYPCDPGYTLSDDGTLTSVTLPTAEGAVAPPGSPTRYMYAHMTLLRYLSCAFVTWRGSIRWKVIPISTRIDMETSSSVVARFTPGAIINVFSTFAPTINRFRTFMCQQWDDVGGLSGVQVSTSIVNPNHSFEMPFQTNYRFGFGRRTTDFRSTAGSNFTDWMQLWKMRVQFLFQQSIPHTLDYVSMCAAGEDFTVGMYLGPPVFFYDRYPPTALVS